jgi:CheY-like chemotaxis protein
MDLDSVPGTASATISAKVVASANAAKSSQEAIPVKQAVSSASSGGNQPAKAIAVTDDDDTDSAAIVGKAIDTKNVGKSPQDSTLEKETLSSENPSGNQLEKPTKKERVESVINLDQPSMMAAQVREEARLTGATPNPPTEARGEFTKDIATASRRDFRKGPGNDDDKLLANTQPGPDLAPWLTGEIDSSQGNSLATNIWDGVHFPTSFLLPRAELEGNQSLEQGGILGPSLAKGGDSPGLQETVLSTTPLWGAFFLQSLGRLRPRPDQPTIMVVEGDEGKRDQLVMTFAEQGYLVLSAPTTHDAMGLLRAPLSPIDLVVLNLTLPDVSGLHLCTYLRKSNPGLQLIVYSDEAEPSELPQLLKLGVNHYLPNPFSLQELVAGVNSLLHGTTREAGGM